MPPIFRSFSANSSLSLVHTTAQSSQTCLPDIDDVDEPVFGPETAEDAAFRDSLRLRLAEASTRVARNFGALNSCDATVAPQDASGASDEDIVAEARDESEVLDRSEQDRCAAEFCFRCSHPALSPTTTMQKRSYRDRVDALRRAQLAQVFGMGPVACTDRPPLDRFDWKTSTRTWTSLKAMVADILGKSCHRNASPSDDHCGSKGRPQAVPGFVLPREIVMALSRVDPSVSTMFRSGDPQAYPGSASIAEQARPIYDWEIAPDDGIPSFENPFSSLFGMVKETSLLPNDIDEPYSRLLRSRFLVHEMLRSNLMRILPDYRRKGDTGQDAAMSLMPGMLRGISHSDQASEEEPETDLDPAVYAVAILQGFIDRCHREGW